MSKIYGLLEDELEVQIVLTVDEVCKNCPSNQDSECLSLKKVKLYDWHVFKMCNLIENEIYTYKELHTRVIENIIHTGKMKEICSDCCWSSICHKK